jgi:hypothetical protein
MDVFSVRSGPRLYERKMQRGRRAEDSIEAEKIPSPEALLRND